MPRDADGVPSSSTGPLDSDVLVAAGLLEADSALTADLTVEVATERLRSLLSPAALWVCEPLSPGQASQPSREGLGRVPEWRNPTLDPLDPVVGIVRSAWSAALPSPRASWGPPVLRLQVSSLKDARRLRELDKVGAYFLVPCISTGIPDKFSWRWPLRVGIGAGPRSLLWQQEFGRSPYAQLYDGRIAVSGDEGPLDILLVDAEAPPPPLTASCIILIGGSTSPAELVARGHKEFQSAIVAGVDAADISWFDEVIRGMAHDLPVDVALRFAVPSSLVAGDAYLLNLTAVRQWVLEVEDQIREPEIKGPNLVPAKDLLHQGVVTPDFAHEYHGALFVTNIIRSLEAAGYKTALEMSFATAAVGPHEPSPEPPPPSPSPPPPPSPAPPPPPITKPPAARRLIAEARAGKHFRRQTLLPNTDHDLLVRIAIPKKSETASPAAFDDTGLASNESVELMVHVTSAPIGLLASLPIVLSTGDRTAPSTTALFTFHTKDEGSVVDIKILVTYRQRPLQEAHYVATVRSRSVPGDRVRINPVALSSSPEPLKNTTAAQLSLVVDGANLRRLGTDRAIDLNQLRPYLDELEQAASRVVGKVDAPENLDAEKATALLVDLARSGARLKEFLAPLDIGDAATVSLVVDATTPVLPLELAYDAPSPLVDAKLCEHRPGGTMVGKPEVCPDAGDKVVCPYGFWGQHRVVARTIRLDSRPVRRSAIEALSLRPVLYAATTRADDGAKEDRKPSDLLAAELTRIVGSANLTRVTSWGAWKRAVKQSHPQLLVVLGHTENDGAETILEIGAGEYLRSFDVKPELLLSGQAPPPLVILVACATAVPVDDFGGLPAAFTCRGAAAVVATITKMNGPQAARAAAAVVGAIRDDSTGHDVHLGRALTAARHQLIAQGLLVGLFLVSHGEIDLVFTP